MRYHFWVLYVFFLGIFGCASDSRQLVWSDEFNNNGQPDSSYWNFELGNGCPNCGWGNNEEQYYTKDAANIQIENGHLVIEAIKGDTLWTSGRLTTKGKFNFQYGTIEYRAKLPSGVGTWPALWLLGERIAEIGWPGCGEIDVMEHVGKNPGVVQSALHTSSSSGDTKDKGETKVPTYASDFHNYAAQWTKEKIEFSVDDKVFYTYQPQIRNAATWPFESPFFIIVNIAMGGNMGGSIDPVLSKARMEIDYIRVYK